MNFNTFSHFCVSLACESLAWIRLKFCICDCYRCSPLVIALLPLCLCYTVLLTKLLVVLFIHILLSFSSTNQKKRKEKKIASAVSFVFCTFWYFVGNDAYNCGSHVQLRWNPFGSFYVSLDTFTVPFFHILFNTASVVIFSHSHNWYRQTKQSFIPLQVISFGISFLWNATIPKYQKPLITQV